MAKLLDNKLDKFFEEILDNFFEYITKNKLINKINKDINFVTFQNLILEEVSQFTDIKNSNISKLMMKHNYFDSSSTQVNSASKQKQKNLIYDYLTRYCYYYIYSSISYFYEGGKELYTTNIIEISGNQKNSKIQVENFFNSDSNSKLISFFNILKNFQNI